MKKSDLQKLHFEAAHIAYLAETACKINNKNWRQYEAKRGSTIECIITGVASLATATKKRI